MSDSATATATKTKVKLPRQFKAVMLNDDYTPMDWVINILMGVFDKDEDEAINLTKAIHNHGRAIVYVNSIEMVRAKVEDALKLAEKFGHSHFKVIKEEA